MAAGDVDVQITDMRPMPCNLFDGVDDYVEIPHAPEQLGANLSSGFTIGAWVCPRSAGEGAATASGEIFSKGTLVGEVGFQLLGRQDNAKINFYLTSGSKMIETNAPSFGVWYHYLITVTGANPAIGNLYRDGVLAVAANTNLVNSVANITDTGVMRIGNNAGATTTTFDGAIKDVKMWNRVLTAAEITALGEGVTTGLIHHFKLGGDYTDYGSVGVTATNSGSVSTVIEDQVAAAIKAQRVTANDKFMVDEVNGRIVSTRIEAAP